MDDDCRWKQLLDEWSAEELPLQHTESSNNLLGNSSSSMLVSADHSAAAASASPAEAQLLSAGAGNLAIADTVDGASKAQQQGSAEGMPQKQPEEGTGPEAMDGALRSPVQQMRESAVSPGVSQSSACDRQGPIVVLSVDGMLCCFSAACCCAHCPALRFWM